MDDTSRLNVLSKWIALQFPYALLVVMIFADAIPMTIGNGFLFAPSFSFLALYYLSVNKPGIINPLTLFILAVLRDILIGDYLGMTAFTWLIVNSLSLRHRQFYQLDPRFDGWLAFSVMYGFYLSLLWVLHGIVEFRFDFSMISLFSWGCTIALYPWFSSLLFSFDRRIKSFVWGA